MTFQEIIKYCGENIDLVQLIDCQQAEIDNLRADLKRVCAERDAHIATTKFIRAEAVKEFAERLKDKLLTKWDYQDAVDIEEIDNLVKKYEKGR